MIQLIVQAALSPGVKRPEREFNHSPPSSVDVNDAWSFSYTRIFMESCIGTKTILPLALLNSYVGS
jgi:hypothetical protein